MDSRFGNRKTARWSNDHLIKAICVLGMLFLGVGGLTPQPTVQAAPPQQNLNDLCSLFPALPRVDKLMPGADRSKNCGAMYYPEPKCPDIYHAYLTITKYASAAEAKAFIQKSAPEYKPTSAFGDDGRVWDNGQNKYICGFDPSAGSTMMILEGYYLNFVCGPYLVGVFDNGFHVDDARAIAKDVDKTLKSLNACSGVPEPEAPANPPPANPPANPNPTGFTVQTFSCASSKKETGRAGRIYCVASCINSPGGDTTTYFWTIDGRPAGGNRNEITLDNIAKGEHVVTVRAANKGVFTTLETKGVTVYEAPEGAGGASVPRRAEVNGPAGQVPLVPGQKALMQLKPGERAQVNVAQPDGSNAQNVFNLSSPSQSSPGGGATLFDVEILFPGLVERENRSTLKLASVLAADASAQLNITLNSGILNVEILPPARDVAQVTTSLSVVKAEGKNNFSVTRSQDGSDLVVSYVGRVEVQPLSGSGAPLILSTGDQVQVTKTGVGAVGSVPLDQNPALMSLGMYLLGGCTCLGLVGVLGIVLLTRMMGSKKKPPFGQPVPYPVNLPPPYAVPPGGYAPVGAAPMARLVVSRGSASRPWLDLNPAGVIVGREVDCGLVLYDPASAPHHARVDFVNGTWVITDLNSGSGTWVNGVRITQQALRPGDVVRLGQVELAFQ
jgi:hypothetical protein